MSRNASAAAAAVHPQACGQVTTLPGIPRRAATFVAALLLGIAPLALQPALARAQNIYGDPWQNAAWQTVSNQPNIQYRWIGGGSSGESTIWAGCKVQLRTTDGSQFTVSLNVFFADADAAESDDWWHIPDLTVNGNGAYGVYSSHLLNLEGDHGCARVDRIEVNDDAPDDN